VTIATTRPETMLGDVAVAVNAADSRYAHLRGKTLRLPLMNRDIPVIEDELANPEFGTGAVKVTPAHDPNDFQAGLRHKLPQINIMTPDAHINENGGVYAGLDRFEARKRVLADLETQGFLVGVKDHTFSIGKCDRCKTIVEPRLSTQWFVRIQPLADRAIAAVEQGFIRFTPENYKTIYLNWMRNIYDWCISRQLWWGHRIPAWHCGECGEINVAREAPSKCHECGSGSLTQDPDVLDTWFSSALLPFTAFAWPEKTRDLETFYPTTLLVTGFDILFFWVARMIMMGCWFMGGEAQAMDLSRPADRERLAAAVPFKNVYIHALVRDAERQKMSKTKGNVLDPIEVIERFGTDATRFTLAAMASPGTDIAFNENRTEGYRNFANKIWNAARFIFMNVDRAQEAGAWSLRGFLESNRESVKVAAEVPLEERWIQARLVQTARDVNQALAGYRFHEAANLIYDFIWKDFCDWYLEMVKLRLDFSNVERRPHTHAALEQIIGVFAQALVMLSPFMPFITEEIWFTLWEGKPPHKSIAFMPYPRREGAIDEATIAEMALLQELIADIRNRRAELKIEPKVKAPVQLHAADGIRELVQQNRDMIEKLANTDGLQFMDHSIAKLPGCKASQHYEVAVIYEQKIDPVVERERLNKELLKMEKEFTNAQRQLGNDAFLSKAPANVVDGLRKRTAELETLIPKTRSALEQLR
jgi:valyl-tRNA synthetase